MLWLMLWASRSIRVGLYRLELLTPYLACAAPILHKELSIMVSANGERGKCLDCFAFRAKPLSGPVQIGVQGPAGVCIYNPPQLVAMNTPQGLAVQTMFPPMPANGFCEQYKLKEVSDAEATT